MSRLVTAVLLSLILALPAAAQSTVYKLIVHRGNSVRFLTQSDAAMLFLKKAKTWQKWGSAEPVLVVDLGQESDVREAFSGQVLGKRIEAVRAYWRQQLFSGNAVPPLEVASDSAAVAYVARTPGAIAYVSRSAKLPDGVREVMLDK